MNQVILTLIQQLKKQPIFHLSLADKELFHSNFLAWLALEYPTFFLSVLEGMITQEGTKVNTAGWRKDYLQNKLTVKREYNNFDLCILREVQKKKGIVLEPVFILENKNKSIPYLSQLQNYNEKLKQYKPERLLLSLATHIPDRKNITNAGWKIVSYGDLAKAMRNVPKSIKPYPRALIKDYQKFVSNLAELSDKLLRIKSYFIDDKVLQELAECRMDDLAQKIRYSSFAAELSTNTVVSRKIVIADSREMKDNAKYPPGTVYVGQDYTSRGGATGIIQLAVKLHENYALKIQVQGEHYRHALEWLGTGASCTKETMTQLLNSKDIKAFFEEDAFEEKELFEDSFYPVKQDGNDCDGEEQEEKKAKIYGYNHFGLGFQYRSKKLLKNQELTYQKLLSQMINDLSLFLGSPAQVRG